MTSMVYDLLSTCTSSAVHLEMRDAYMQDDPAFLSWKAGRRLDAEDRRSWWRPWLDAVAAATARGVEIRRARIVSEPVTEYIAYEYDITWTNVAAGETVRWLPRRQAATLLVPGCDFWLFDGSTVVFNHFTGDGQSDHPNMVEEKDTAVAERCATAFEAVWERAVDHELYSPAR
jgi:hypothetical protein